MHSSRLYRDTTLKKGRIINHEGTARILQPKPFFTADWRFPYKDTQEFKQEAIRGSFIGHDLHMAKLIDHNCFLWASCSRTRLFTRAAACSGEPDTNTELGNLLMLLCIPVLQITRYPYQEGSQATQFRHRGLSPKVARVRHNPPAHKQAPNTALDKTPSGWHTRQAPAHGKPFPFVYFAGWALKPPRTSESAFLPTPELGWQGLWTLQRRLGDGALTACRHPESCTSAGSWETVREEKRGRLALDFRVSRSERLKTQTPSNTDAHKRKHSAVAPFQVAFLQCLLASKATRARASPPHPVLSNAEPAAAGGCPERRRRGKLLHSCFKPEKAQTHARNMQPAKRTERTW